MKFFNYNSETNRISILIDEYIMLEPFRELQIKHKKGQDISIEQELTYIWYVTDIISPGLLKGLNEKELHSEAIKEFKIGKDWKPDDITQHCIDYINDNKTALEKAIIELLRSIQHTNNIIEYVNDYLHNISINKTLTDQEIGLFFSYQDKLQGLIKKLPDLYKDMNELEQKYKDDLKGIKLARGKVVITDSMEGDGE